MSMNLVNPTNSNYSGNLFTELPVAKDFMSNVDAANASKIVLTGGKKRIYKSKINKISRMYKMRGSRKNISRRVRHIKSRVRHAFRKSKRKCTKCRRNKRQRGGSSSYSTGAALPASLSALANPVPFMKLDDSVNCPSSYNHYK